MKHVCIIGTGWYGCHIASVLKDKFEIIMIDKQSEIFDNSSYYNQNRLHLGFHYCRHYKTRNLCQKKYDMFFEKYSSIVEYIDNNFYLISNDSLLDYQTFLSIYNYEKFCFETIDNKIFNNIDGKIIKVNECVINSDKAKEYFQKELENIKKIMNTTVHGYTKNSDIISVETNIGNIECDIILDCTFNQLGFSKKIYVYENTISLLFKKINDCKFDAITIMDGQFLSLYPRDINNNIYSLTDVEHTPLIKSTNYQDILNFQVTEEIIENVKNKIIKKTEIYYPDFLKSFEYNGYFLSKKTKQISSSDSRDIIIEEIEPNVISVNCGKIYGIFDWEEYIVNKLIIKI